MSKVFNKEKFADILSGEKEPETKGEEVLLIAYKSALQGMLLQDLIITEFYEIFDGLTKEELLYANYGYAVGQKLSEEQTETLLTMPANNGSKYKQ